MNNSSDNSLMIVMIIVNYQNLLIGKKLLYDCYVQHCK